PHPLSHPTRPATVQKASVPILALPTSSPPPVATRPLPHPLSHPTRPATVQKASVPILALPTSSPPPPHPLSHPTQPATVQKASVPILALPTSSPPPVATRPLAMAPMARWWYISAQMVSPWPATSAEPPHAACNRAEGLGPDSRLGHQQPTTSGYTASSDGANGSLVVY
ncbi:hypothetical protein PHYSODRAFT_513217, partial [Phytophthora sojae]